METMTAASEINAAFSRWLDATSAAEAHDQSDLSLQYRRFGATIAAVETEAEYLMLYRIHTDPEHRNEGSATALLALLKNICDEHHVTLLAQAEGDPGLDHSALLRWYQRNGFSVDSNGTANWLVWYPCRPGA